MIFFRLCPRWLFCFLALGARLAAQDAPGGASSGTPADSTTGASSAFGPIPSAPSTTGGAALPSVNPASYEPVPGAAEATSTAPSSAAPPPSTSVPLPGGGPAAEVAPTTFSISTAYGKAPDLFVSGEGRLAQPRYVPSFSASIGFDDNVFQTPTKAKGTPATVVRQEVSAGPPAVFQDIVIPATPKPKRQGSAVSRESVSFETQMASRRTVFTFDINVNSDYYWNRPGKKSEYNGSLALRYLHRFSPRVQVTASVDASYLSQPDLSQINTPTSVGTGNYLVLNGKTDISYRWAPRFSTVASLSYNQLSYEDKLRQAGDYRNIILGLELRYLWSPRLTLVAEGRLSRFTYPDNSALDSLAYFGLVGFDWSLSRRGSIGLRMGESVRTFDESGGDSSAPYVEATLTYQLDRANVVSWGNRFGFEEPSDPNSEILSFRSTLGLTHFFGPRLRGALSFNGIRRVNTNNSTNTSLTEDTLDSTLSLFYTMTRQWSFNMNYSYTAVFTDPSESNYYRDRVFAGFDYSF